MHRVDMFCPSGCLTAMPTTPKYHLERLIGWCGATKSHIHQPSTHLLLLHSYYPPNMLNLPPIMLNPAPLIHPIIWILTWCTLGDLSLPSFISWFILSFYLILCYPLPYISYIIFSHPSSTSRWCTLVWRTQGTARIGARFQRFQAEASTRPVFSR